ncbi:arylsulfatase [Allokutzneria oryzae]|uniref:Arylsulfatase n=1 Tax=Allokutzneria oryzae TaxID=1378989 RepID=A0ABV5ZXH5_9PSEU
MRPPDGAPNVLLILTDDGGFGNPGTFGGPIDTPNLARMAAGGLRYNRFHVTGLCSPTRAAMLTGRNHHAVGFGSIVERPGGWPGYSMRLPPEATPVPQVLRMNGYSTAAIGKWHLTPDNHQGPAGPFTQWPNACGFDYFWGFLGGDSDQYDPVLVENNTVIGVPPGEDYYLPTASADRAIQWLHGLRGHSADKPFFLYYPTGCSHAPHQVPEEWSEKYRGRFDEGWDVCRQRTFARQKELGVIPPDAQLTPRSPELPAWDSLPPDRQQFFARQMEVYAGYNESNDHEIGRVLSAIEEMGELDNTVVIYIWGDNGTSLEGTPTGTFNELVPLNGITLTYEEQAKLIESYGGVDAWGGPTMRPHYSAAWAWAGNTPFQWGKQIASHLGGTRNPMVVHWPAGIQEPGGLRSQFTHCTDIGPTILEIAGIPQPQTVNGTPQMPVHGTSFAYSLNEPQAAERHSQQYFEMFGNRAMYKDGWWAAARLDRAPWDFTPATLARFAPDVWDPDSDRWELYYLPDDFSQADDLAARYPDKLAELQDLFWAEAREYQVLPLLGSFSVYYGFLPPARAQTTFTYYADVRNVLPGTMPPVLGRSYTISADVEVPATGAAGVIVAAFDYLGGFALYVEEGILKHTYSMLGVTTYTQVSSTTLPAGRLSVAMEFVADAAKPGTGGTATLLVDGRAVGSGRIEHTVPQRFSFSGGMDIGRDNGEPVSRSYAEDSPFPFTGTIHKVVFDVHPDNSAEKRRARAGGL